MISPEDVGEVLRNRFGSALTDQGGLLDKCLRYLNGNREMEKGPDKVAEETENLLFNCLYDHAGAAMTVRMDQGKERRVYLSELPAAADELMGFLFEEMNPDETSYSVLRDYYFASGSFSALQTLYLDERYRSRIPEEDLSVMKKMLQERDAVE